MADFLSLGEMLIDFTPAGRTPAGIPLFEQNPGGAPANVAVQAARLGVSAGFIGKVGRDMFGAFLQQVKAGSLSDTGVAVSQEDQVLSLSTCATVSGEGKLLVSAKYIGGE